MAIARRSSRRSSIDIWPGFVDALAQLLMVIHLHSVGVHRRPILPFGGTFRARPGVAAVAAAGYRARQLLALERRATQDLRVGAADFVRAARKHARGRDRLTEQLRDADTIVSADKEKIELQLREIESLRRDLDALKSVRADLEAKVTTLAQQQAQQDLAALRDRTRNSKPVLPPSEKRTSLAQKEIDTRDIRLREITTRADRAEQASPPRNRSAATPLCGRPAQRAARGVARAAVAHRRSARVFEAKVKEQQGQIVELGKRLNLALVNKVEELARYRSEFFGRLRQILGDRSDIRIVGDRFVFQSEVLFAPGSADLTDDAKKELAPVIAALKEISAKIPPDINWILRIDGHTDRRPISNPQFPSNWELSTARALSVVAFCDRRRIPAARLAAAGFADKQPIDPRAADDAYRRNRRIELKLTSDNSNGSITCAIR